MKKVLTKISLILIICCSFSFNVFAKVSTVLVQDNAFIPNAMTICLGDTIRFVYDVGTTGNHNVHITTPIDSISDTLKTAGNVFVFTPTSQNVYSYNCDIHPGVTGNFTVKGVPVVNLGPDITQCGGKAVLNAGNPGSIYTWSNNATTQTDTISFTGTYWVSVYNTCGNNTDFVNVTIHTPPTVSLGPDIVQCGSSVTLNAGNAGSTYAWSNGATTSAIAVASSGTYFVAIIDANGCHASDTIVISTTGQNPPLIEGFEGAAFPPLGWAQNNPDNGISWAQSTTVAKKGVNSMYMDNFDYAAIGQVDEIITPGIDLSGGSAPAVLSFQVAYQLFSNPSTIPNNSDTLRVQVSTDCGTTWTTLYNKYGTALTTATPTFSSTPFVPSLIQWRLETLALPMASKVMIKFVNITGYQNQLYIDDININNGTGVNDINLDNYVSVFPNPTAGTVYVNVNTPGFGPVNMKLYNVAGEVISETTDNISVPTKFTFDISNQPGGIYFIEIKSENGQSVKKIILNK